MIRNDVLVVDINKHKEKHAQVTITHAQRNGDTVNPVSEEYDVLSDMGMLCEALCVLIHSAEADGVKSSPESLKSCINHLEKGTFDASYFAETFK
jgi:hypothetical protein